MPFLAKRGGPAPRQLSNGCVSLLGIPFLVAGLGMTWWYFHPLASWRAARSWEETPCKIESVQLKHGDDTSRAVATFRYRFRGRDYTGDRVSFWSGYDNVGDFQERTYRELLRNREGFRCFVNPARPSEAVLYRDFRWEMQAFLAVFALTFPAVGAGLIAGGFVGRQRLRSEAGLRDAHPGEPWKWRPEWAADAIPEDGSMWHAALRAYLVWSALVIAPLLAAMISNRLFRSWTAYLTLVFPLLWCLAAWAAFRRFHHRRATGGVRLDLASRPVEPGGRLRADLVSARPLVSRGNVEFTLTCEKTTRETSSDGGDSLPKRILALRQSVAPGDATRDLSGCRLPVAIELPADALETTVEPGEYPKIAWKLAFRVPGTALGSCFVVPVFRRNAGEPGVSAGPPLP